MKRQEIRECQRLAAEAAASASPAALEEIGRAAVEGAICPVCGRPAPTWVHRPGRSRELHFECKEVQAFLSVLTAKIRRVRFAEGSAGDDRIKRLRGALTVILNQDLQRLRARRAEGAEDTDLRPGQEEPAIVAATVAELDEWLSTL